MLFTHRLRLAVKPWSRILYVKLFSQILDSSIWLESDQTLRVWITLLAAMDQDGYAHFAAVGNLANRAHVSVEACQDAVRVLEAPDEYSSDDANEGRRIERVPGGWIVLNCAKYRELGREENRREQVRVNVARHRAKKKEDGNAAVISGNQRVISGNQGVTKSNHMQKQKQKKIQKQNMASSGSSDYIHSEKETHVENGEEKQVLKAAPAVFAYWQEQLNHPTAKLTPKRLQKINARLAEGYSEADLCRAVDGCKASPFHMGQNEHCTVYDQLELICRDGEHIEQFMNYTTKGELTNGGIIKGNGIRRETTSERRWRETRELCQSLEAGGPDTDIKLLSGVPPTGSH